MRNSCRRCRSVQVSKLYLANIYAVYALIRGHPGGVTPGTYVGMARDWSILFANFKSQMGGGGLECFCTFAAGSTGGKTRGICSTNTILQMELETIAVPVYGRTGCVGEHVPVTGFRRERNAPPDPRQTTLQVQEELISRLPIEIYIQLSCYCCGRILGNIGALSKN